MTMTKRFSALLLTLVLAMGLAACGEKPRPSSAATAPSSRPVPESPAPVPESSSPEEAPPVGELLLPPEVPSGEALNGLDLSAMDREALIALLEPVLARARFFCRFGLIADFEGVTVDLRPEAGILRPHRNESEYLFFPYTNLPYKTVEELKEDFRTVFTPEVVESDFPNVFDHLTDCDGRLYFASGLDGYSTQRNWDLSTLEVMDAERDAVTVSMSVTWGPMSPEEALTAPLSFCVKDGYLVMDESYFASDSNG